MGVLHGLLDINLMPMSNGGGRSSGSKCLKFDREHDSTESTSVSRFRNGSRFAWRITNPARRRQPLHTCAKQNAWGSAHRLRSGKNLFPSESRTRFVNKTSKSGKEGKGVDRRYLLTMPSARLLHNFPLPFPFVQKRGRKTVGSQQFGVNFTCNPPD